MNQEQLYSSVLVKIGVERSNLLNKQKLEQLTDCKSLKEFVIELGQTIYEKHLMHLTQPYTTNIFERAFRENFIEVCIKIVRSSPDVASAFLKNYLLKFEHENIKTLLRAISIGLSYDEIKSKIYLPVETFLKRQNLILKAAMTIQVKLAVDALQTTVYGPSLIIGLKKYEETGSTKYFDILLDRMFYENLGKSMKDLPKSDRELAFFYVSRQTDCFNILTILRAKLLGYEPNWIRMTISRNFYNVHKQIIETMITAKNFEEAFNMVKKSYYKKFFIKSDIPQETISIAEKNFRRDIFEHIKKTEIGDPFNVESPIAFILKKEIEVYNLTAISLGIEYNWKKDDILQLLLF